MWKRKKSIAGILACAMMFSAVYSPAYSCYAMDDVQEMDVIAEDSAVVEQDAVSESAEAETAEIQEAQGLVEDTSAEVMEGMEDEIQIDSILEEAEELSVDSIAEVDLDEEDEFIEDFSETEWMAETELDFDDTLIQEEETEEAALALAEIETETVKVESEGIESCLSVDLNAEFNNAPVLQLDQEIPVNLAIDEKAYFKYQPEKDINIVIQSSEDEDTFFRLYERDNSGDFTKRDNYDGDYFEDSLKLLSDLQAGREYLIEISSPYSASLDCVVTASEQKKISNIKITPDKTIYSNLQNFQCSEWEFEMTYTNNKKETITGVGRVGGTEGYSIPIPQIYSKTDGDQFDYEQQLPVGDYEIIFDFNDLGLEEQTINITVKSAGELADTITLGTSVSPNETKKSTYKLTVADTGYYQFRITGSYSFDGDIRLFKEDGNNTEIDCCDSAWQEEEFVAVYYLEAGEYLISLEKSSDSLNVRSVTKFDLPGTIMTTGEKTSYYLVYADQKASYRFECTDDNIDYSIGIAELNGSDECSWIDETSILTPGKPYLLYVSVHNENNTQITFTTEARKEIRSIEIIPDTTVFSSVNFIAYQRLFRRWKFEFTYSNGDKETITGILTPGEEGYYMVSPEFCTKTGEKFVHEDVLFDYFSDLPLGDYQAVFDLSIYGIKEKRIIPISIVSDYTIADYLKLNQEIKLSLYEEEEAFFKYEPAEKTTITFNIKDNFTLSLYEQKANGMFDYIKCSDSNSKSFTVDLEAGKKYLFKVMIGDDSYEATGSIIAEDVHHKVTDAAVAPTCTTAGKTAGSHCSICGKVFGEPQKTIKATGHNLVTDPAVAATCTTAGKTAGSHCSKCKAVIKKQETIPATGHNFGKWKVTKGATVIAKGEEQRTCSKCSAVEKRSIAKLTPTGKVNVKTLPMKEKQKTSVIKVSNLAAGDKVKSYSSSNKKIFTVNSKGTITAKKKGTAKLCITLLSGKKLYVTIKVQKPTVTTTKVSIDQKKLTLKKGKSYTLKTTITPLTSQEKATYKSSNTAVAAVNKKGKITAKKKGSAVITVTSGKKSVKCKVTVK